MPGLWWLALIDEGQAISDPEGRQKKDSKGSNDGNYVVVSLKNGIRRKEDEVSEDERKRRSLESGVRVV